MIFPVREMDGGGRGEARNDEEEKSIVPCFPCDDAEVRKIVKMPGDNN